MNSKVKRLISLALTVVLLFGLVGTAGIFPAYAQDACGYSAAMTISELAESGEAAESGSSYRISGADELRSFAEYVNSGKATEGAIFYLASDINLADYEWTPIASKSACAFSGVFDGCGYAVLNLENSDASSDYALFGFVSGSSAEIKNLGVEGQISGKGSCAGIVANLEGAKVANCWNAVDVNGTFTVGGIAANVKNGTLSNCCNYGYISGTSNVGAIAGDLNGSSVVEYCYYVYYSADKSVGNTGNSSTSSVFRFSTSSTEVLTEKELTVGNKDTDDLIKLLNEWIDLQSKDSAYREWLYDTTASAKARTDGRYPSIMFPNYIVPKESNYTATATMTALSESKQNAVEGGFYSISSTEELQAFRDYVNLGYNTKGVTFYQDDDIIVSKTVDSWIPIGDDDDCAFKGVYDGQGYVLTDIYINKITNAQSLFGYVDDTDALIKNVGVMGIVVGGDNCGGIVGVLNSGTVANCWFDGEMNSKDRIGGIVGKANAAQILNCVNFATLAGDKHIGGIVGSCSNSTTIKYCYYPISCAQGCGETSGTQTAVLAYSKDGSDFTLERSVVVGSASGVKLLNVLNHWVSYLATDNSYRSWKIDESKEGLLRIQGNHPTHLYPGDKSGVTHVDEPHIDIDNDVNPYNVHYSETATMTELYESGVDALQGGHYSISTAKELQQLALFVKENHSTKNATFYLTKDIDISIRALGNDAEGWLPIGCDHRITDTESYSYIFRGNFDGCGYTVSNLYIYDEKGDNVGLFGRVRDGVIKNLGVTGGIVGEYDCGGIVGKLDHSTIKNCWSAVSIQSESETGGIVGRADNSTIENCVSYGALLCYGGETCDAGGIAGAIQSDCTITNCYYLKDSAPVGYDSINSSSTADIIPFTSGFFNDDYYCTLERAAAIDELSTTSLLDALNAWVRAQNNGMFSGWYNSAVPIGAEGSAGHFPRLMVPGEYQGSLENEDYSGDYTATSTMKQLLLSESDGIEGCCYSINGLDDLEALQQYVLKGHKTKGIIFFMTRDLSMNAKYHIDGNSWTPIGDVNSPFQGIFDGQGYTIKYLYIDTSADDQGLFGHVNQGATIKNLGICGSVRAGLNAGSIVGDFNFSTIANCWSSCIVNALDGNAGGIVGGANGGTIVNCASYGEVMSVDAYGAIAGYAFATQIKYCYYLYGTCQQAYSGGSAPNAVGVQYFNGTSSACILHEKVNVEGTETRNMLSALKLYVDAHPETNYCYWVIGNTAEYLEMGVGLFPVLLSASNTMGEKDHASVQAYFNGQEYYSVIKAINAANDAEGGGDVTLATNVVLYVRDDVTLDSDVRLLTGNYSAVIKSEVKVQSMQQLDGYYTVKEGGKILVWDNDKNDYSLFMFAKKDAEANCNSEIYSTGSLVFRSMPVDDGPSEAYNISLENGEFIVNSTIDSGNPHGIPGGSTISIQSHATLNVAPNARIRTTGGAVIMNEGNVKIGNAVLDRNTGIKMVGVFEDDGGIVTLPYIYKEGYTLKGWDDGTTTYPAGSKVSVPKETTFTAKWSLGESADPYPGDDAYSEDRPVYNIPITVIQSNGGTISPESIMAAKGENLTFKVKADSGYLIYTVLVDGKPVELDEENCYTFISISREHNIVALFTKLTNDSYYNWNCPYDDVSRYEWYYESIRYAASAGFFNGTTEKTFSPEDAMTREMLVTVLWRMAGCPVVPSNAGQTFIDVPKSSYAYDAIRWATMFGIINGYGDGRFGYGDMVLREQLVAAIFRYAKNYVGVDVSLYDSTNILGYSDVLQISMGMSQPFQWAVGAGIILGTSETTLEPKGMATRAQVAAVIYRFNSRFVDQVPIIKT